MMLIDMQTKKSFFVLRQKGNIVEIVNDEKFKPKEWKVNY